jgi:tetratricopeptide (TPR) repeat protein
MSMQLAEAHYGNGEVNTATSYFAAAVPEAQHLAEQHPDNRAEYLSHEAEATFGLAKCELETADYDAAKEHHERALQLTKQAGEPRGSLAATVLLSLGTLHGMLGGDVDAFSTFRRGERLVQDLDDPVLTGFFLGAQAIVRMDIGDLDVAYELTDRASQIAAGLNDVHLERESATTLARIHLCCRNVSEARRAADAAVKLSGPHRSFGALALQGLAAWRGRDTESARHAFTAASNQIGRILNDDGDNVELLDYAGLAACGLAMCEDFDKAGFGRAERYYRKARTTNPRERVVRRSTRLLVQLMKGAAPAQRERMLRAAAGQFYKGI